MFHMTDENWRKQNKTISSKLKVILRQEVFTDVSFIVQGREFKCHKLILAIGSPYFQRAYHIFRNADSPPITISDITPEAFRIVLNFLYTDKVTFGSENQAFEAYEAAVKFEMADLKSECEIYLSELDFRPHTIWNHLERASALEMQKIQAKYIDYIQNNAHLCLTVDSFLKTTGEVLMQIMKSNTLNVSELDLANALLCWGKTKNPKLLKVILQPYLRHIRFKVMTPKEFCFFTKMHPDLISSADSLAILRYLEVPEKNSLPTWCCQLSKRRDALEKPVGKNS